jgi:hypothetical protein
VQSSTGVISYYDVIVNLSTSTAGALSVTSTEVTKSKILSSSNFQQGNYVGPYSNWVGVLGGPGVAPGGTNWSFQANASSGDCPVPVTASWYTGPISNSPEAAMLQAAGIKSTAYSYGAVGIGNECGGDADNWQPGAVIGAAQTGNTLTIVSFTDGSGKTHGTPIDQVTWHLTK